jgi:hypothetical protein
MNASTSKRQGSQPKYVSEPHVLLLVSHASATSPGVLCHRGFMTRANVYPGRDSLDAGLQHSEWGARCGVWLAGIVSGKEARQFITKFFRLYFSPDCMKPSEDPAPCRSLLIFEPNALSKESRCLANRIRIRSDVVCTRLLLDPVRFALERRL